MEKEVWKEYPLKYDFEGYYKVEVSNLGRARTSSTYIPEGKIINGSLQGGFPIIRLKLFKKRSDVDFAKLQLVQFQIEDLNEKIKALKSDGEELQEKLKLRETRDEFIQKRKKMNARINKKRAIHPAILVHKAVAELFLDAPENEDQKFVIHLDYDKTNNKVENLAWASQEELNVRYMKHPKNVMYAFNKQFTPAKPRTKGLKLTDADVLHIKTRLKKGDTLRKLAQKYNVSDMQIHRIKTGENWGHIKTVDDLIQEKENQNKENKKWQAT